MKIASIQWTVVRIPFARPFHTARGVFHHRSALLLRVRTDDGLEGIGEGSAHPALGQEGLLDSVTSAIDLPKARDRYVDDLAVEDLQLPLPLASALDTALCDLISQARRLPVAGMLSDEWTEAVPVNATIGADSAAEAAAEAIAARERGYMCFKLKVGTASTLSKEMDRVAAVRHAIGPVATLRLDANGAWPPEEAITAIRALSRFDLEFVEQPCPTKGIDGMAHVRKGVDVPIAADEPVTGLDAARRIVLARAADIIVVKPLLVGGLRQARCIMEMANDSGIECVVTTSIDSGVGTAAALHLAATLPPLSRACGLATAHLLAGDLLQNPLPIEDGYMRVPRQGLGVALDYQQVAKYAIREGYGW